jgi:hypothetical protein
VVDLKKINFTDDAITNPIRQKLKTGHPEKTEKDLKQKFLLNHHITHIKEDEISGCTVKRRKSNQIKPNRIS